MADVGTGHCEPLERDEARADIGFAAELSTVARAKSAKSPPGLLPAGEAGGSFERRQAASTAFGSAIS